MNKRLATLPLREKALDGTPQEVVALLSRPLSRVDEPDSRWKAGKRPAALFSDAFTSCRGMNAAPV